MHSDPNHTGAYCFRTEMKLPEISDRRGCVSEGSPTERAEGL